VIFTHDRAVAGRSPNHLELPLVLAGLFALLLVVLVVVNLLPVIVPAVYLVVSLITYWVYDCDKRAAQNGDWRTSEMTLHLLALCGGWLGALIAQQHFRHKNKKAEFQFVFALTVVVNCGVLAWLVTPFGAAALSQLISRLSGSG
jgi:uncharacterized membrane protein YsdA (DUF1294 family)